MDKDRVELNKILDDLKIVRNEQTQDAEIKRELRAKIKQIHPDQNKGGGFKSKKDKVQCEKMTYALDLLKRLATEPSSSISIKSSDFMTVLNENRKVVVNNAEEQLRTNLSDIATSLHDGLRLPKVSSLTFSGIITFIWLFPNLVKDNPLLGTLIYSDGTANPVLSTIWFTTIMFTIALWFSASVREDKMKAFGKFLKRELTQNQLFADYIKTQKVKKGAKKIIFSRESFTSFVANWKFADANHQSIHGVLTLLFRRHITRFSNVELDEDTIETLANLILERALQKNIIIQLSEKTMTDIFEVTDGVKLV